LGTEITSEKNKECSTGISVRLGPCTLFSI